MIDSVLSVAPKTYGVNWLLFGLTNVRFAHRDQQPHDENERVLGVQRPRGFRPLSRRLD